MMRNILFAMLATLVVVGLVAAVAVGVVVVPPPSGAALAAQYWQAPWGAQPLLQMLGLGVVLLVNFWPLAVIALLAVAAAWLWFLQTRNEEMTAYIEHAHSLEVALRQAREQVEFATTAWDGFNQKLDELFGQTSELMVVVHPITGIKRWNTAALALAKRHNPSLVNLEGKTLAAVNGAEALQQALQRAATENQVWQGEVQLPGLPQWFVCWMMPLGHDVLVVMRDVSALHRDAGHLQSAELILRQVVEESVRPAAVLDANWRYMYVSHKWPETLGLNPSQSLVGQEHWAVSPHFPANKGVLLQQLASGQTLGQQEERTTINGREVTLAWFVRPWKDAGGSLGGYVFGVQDVTEQHRLKQQVTQAEDRENQLAYADTLTGLPNRQLFNDRLNVALAQAYRHLGKLAIVFLDLDGFKGVNDRFGHAGGDLLLKQVAARLQQCIRTSDTLARLGGDEFTMILNIRDANDAEVVAQKVLESIRAPYDLNGQVVDTVGTSIGIALYPQTSTGAAELIKAADNAMYAAKEAGKNTYRFAQPPKE